MALTLFSEVYFSLFAMRGASRGTLERLPKVLGLLHHARGANPEVGATSVGSKMGGNSTDTQDLFLSPKSWLHSDATFASPRTVGGGPKKGTCGGARSTVTST